MTAVLPDSETWSLFFQWPCPHELCCHSEEDQDEGDHEELRHVMVGRVVP